MPLDSHYFTSVSLQNLFVDKDTGAPLSGGFVRFWQDDNRLIPKLVYELNNIGGVAPPNYDYVALPNPLQLSSVGTPMDASGKDVTIYYYPYDANGDLQLYFVQVFNSLGVPQFTREAWPNVTAQTNPENADVNISNAITNSQFVDVLFIPTTPFSIPYTGVGTSSVQIAPNWTLNFSFIGAGNITVTRTSIAGNLAYPNNPPYVLTVTPGANITAISLSQRFFNNPDIFSPPAAGANGWLAGSVLLAPGSSLVMNYQPSGGAPQQVLNANNISANYEEFDATVQLLAAANPATSDTGYVDIVLVLPTVVATSFSNVQVVGLNADESVVYEQTSVNRQKAELFYYYNTLLQKKPIPSHLIGWDFALNPTQFLGPTIAASAAGANTSKYVWDQTILFQSVNNGAAVSRSALGNGALRITATNATQFAIVQYVPTADARKILNDRIASNVSALTSQVGGIVSTISLWYTTGALPSTAANNSIVATLDANGKPLTFNGAWNEVPRLLPTASASSSNAQFTIGVSATTNFNDYGFSGWDMQGIAACNTATFFAIVVGTATLNIGQTVDISSVSLVSGDIPTRPAPTSGGDTLRKCMFYYQKSFYPSVVPAQNAGITTGEVYWNAIAAGAVSNQNFQVYLAEQMYSGGTLTYTLYNPQNNNAQARNLNTGTDCTLTAVGATSFKSFTIQATSPAGTNVGNALIIHYTVDGRLGL